MKIKISELTGVALDWVVAKCEARDKTYLNYFASHWHLNESLRYSTNWARGGPIIDREKMSVLPFDDIWEARCKSDIPRTVRFVERRGPTLLIAAMRCYVAAKLGDEVEIPEELV